MIITILTHWIAFIVGFVACALFAANRRPAYRRFSGRLRKKGIFNYGTPKQ